MDKILINLEITNKRKTLEYMIDKNLNLQSKDVIDCSVELDKLITKYHQLVFN